MVNLLKPIFTILLWTLVQGSFAFGEEGNKEPAITTSWKVVVYMQADNDLSPYAFWDLAEMEKGFSPEVPVLVEIDLPGDEGIKRLQIQKAKEEINFNQTDFTNWSLKNLNSKIIKTLPEVGQTQTERMLNFLIEMEERYPTDHTLFVVWGHGEGFSAGKLAQFGGVAIDDNPKSKVTVEELKKILKTYKTVFNKGIDIVSMDACLMQTLEVALELKDEVRYLVGSTQIQDFRGLPYDSILEYISKNLSSSYDEAYDLALNIPLLFEKRARAEFDNDKRTMSSVNLKELEHNFIPALEKASELINSYINEDPFRKLDILLHQEDLPFYLGESRDLTSLLSTLEYFFIEQKEPEIVKALAKASQAASMSLMSYYYGDYYIYEHRFYLGSFKGFGIWFPSSVEAFIQRSPDFEKSELFKIAPEWKKLLQNIYSEEL